MSFLSELRCLALAVVVGLAGCGGSGGGSDADGAEPVPSSGMSGKVLVSPAGPTDAAIVSVAQGTQQALPRSAYGVQSDNTDAWYPGKSRSEVIRVDDLGNVDFIDIATGQRTGGFSLRSLPNTNEAEFWGPPKLSPDGAHVLAYWKRNHRQDDSELVVLDRAGNAVLEGSPYAYDRFWNSDAFDWLPDGRFVYLAGSRIVVQGLTTSPSVVGELALPANASPNGATLVTNPDGSKLLLSLQTSLLSDSGLETVYYLLYQANLDGSGLRQRTTASDSVRNRAVRMFHRDQVWSPDGKWIAFLPLEGAAYGAPFFRNACPYAIVLSADADATVSVDGLNDPADMRLQAGGNASSVQQVESCGLLGWLSAP